MMRRGYFANGHVAAIVLALLCLSRSAVASQIVGMVDIGFTADSTLHKFSSTTTSVALVVVEDPGQASRRWHADIEVPVLSLQTGNERRDKGMHEMLHAASYPTIRGAFRDIDPVEVRRSGRLPFLLTIGTVTAPVSASIGDWQEANHNLTFTVEFLVSLEAFQLEAPSVLFIHVADSVHVTARVTLREVQ